MNGEFVHGYRVYGWEVVEANFTSNDFLVFYGDDDTFQKLLFKMVFYRSVFKYHAKKSNYFVDKKFATARTFAEPRDLINSIASRGRASGIKEFRAIAVPIDGDGDIMLFDVVDFKANPMIIPETLNEYIRTTTGRRIETKAEYESNLKKQWSALTAKKGV